MTESSVNDQYVELEEQIDNNTLQILGQGPSQSLLRDTLWDRLFCGFL